MKLLCPLFFQRNNTTLLNVFCIFARHVNYTCGFVHKTRVYQYSCNAEAETEIKMTKNQKANKKQLVTCQCVSTKSLFKAYLFFIR